MACRFPNILTSSEEVMLSNADFFRSVGFTDDNIAKMASMHPQARPTQACRGLSDARKAMSGCVTSPASSASVHASRSIQSKLWVRRPHAQGIRCTRQGGARFAVVRIAWCGQFTPFNPGRAST